MDRATMRTGWHSDRRRSPGVHPDPLDARRSLRRAAPRPNCDRRCCRSVVSLRPPAQDSAASRTPAPPRPMRANIGTYDLHEPRGARPARRANIARRPGRQRVGNRTLGPRLMTPICWAAGWGNGNGQEARELLEPLGLDPVQGAVRRHEKDARARSLRLNGRKRPSGVQMGRGNILGQMDCRHGSTRVKGDPVVASSGTTPGLRVRSKDQMQAVGREKGGESSR